MTNEQNKDDLAKLKREIILLQREINHLKFKNSFLFKTLNIINWVIFICFLQYILSYIFSSNNSEIPNSKIEFKTHPYKNENVKLYTIIFSYKNYYFKVKVNKEIDKGIIYSDAIISKDLVFQIPQKLKFKNLNNRWFFIYESLGILTICSILIFTQIVVFYWKQNEEYYPLLTITTLNSIAFIGISIFALYIHKIF
ncbi:MAG TPA: hypothetical protein PK995_02355 [Bacteroidia bacterium]|nr:hypothetical protein [Bacteroidia bacterium]